MPPKKGKRGVRKGTKLAVSEEVKPDLAEEGASEVGPELDQEVKVGVSEGLLRPDVPSEDLSGTQNVLDPGSSELPVEPPAEDTDMEVDDGSQAVELENMNVDLDTQYAMESEMVSHSVDPSFVPPPPPEPHPDDQAVVLSKPDAQSPGWNEPEVPMEELKAAMEALLESLADLSRQLEEEQEEEEEGAIREDEVPFDRWADVKEPSRVLLLLNLPPELEPERLVKLFLKHAQLLSNASVVSRTQLKLFFTNQASATLAKTALDGLKIYNRKLQSLYHHLPVTAHTHPPTPAQPPVPPLPPLVPGRPMPPAPPPGFQNGLQTRIGANGLVGFGVPPPPSKTYTGGPQEKNKIQFNKYKLLNVTLQQLMLDFYNEADLEPGSGVRWDETRTFYENQVQFDRMYEKLGVSTRYVLLGNLGEKVLENSDSVHNFLARFTTNTYTYQVIKLPASYPVPEPPREPGDMAVDPPETAKKWLYVTFDRNREGSAFFNKLTSLAGFGDADLAKVVLRYSCPMNALESLWVSNVAEFCGYFGGEDELHAFFAGLGSVRSFKLVYESCCVFVTYQDKYVAAKVYNFLNGLSPKRVIKLASFNTTNPPPPPPPPMGAVPPCPPAPPDYPPGFPGLGLDGEVKPNKSASDLRGRCSQLFELEKDDDLLNVDFSGRTENSFVLGQKLLNAIKRRADSQELIDRLLNTNDFSHLLPETMNKRHKMRPDYGRRPSDRYQDRRPPRDSYYGHRGDYKSDYRGDYRPDYRSDYRSDYRGDREMNRFRQRYPISKERVDRFGRTIRNDRLRREEPWKSSRDHADHPHRDHREGPPRDGVRNTRRGDDRDLPDLPPNPPPPPYSPPDYDPPSFNQRPPPDQKFGDDAVDIGPEPYGALEPPRDKFSNMDMVDGNRGLDEKGVFYCKLLKRGKFICRVSCVFVRGDRNCKLPELLDVNQRANPERLKNCLTKSTELSLWQLGADSQEDSAKYDSLCDYLIAKNRVALVQQGPFDVYIVPPLESYVSMLGTPDAGFMYAFLLPRAA